LRLDEFERAPDGDLSRRDLARMLLFGFDIAPLAPSPCPQPPVPRFFRLDEFAVVADGTLDARDRTRFTSFGFDLPPTNTPCSSVVVYVNAPGVTVVVIVDRDLLKEIQLSLVEDPVDSGQSYTSGLWSAQEVIDYLNQRQDEFLKLTAIRLRRSRISTIPQVQRHPLPEDWISTQRVAFVDPGGRKRSLHRVDHHELDNALEGWQHRSTRRPRFYTDGNLPTHTIEIAPQGFDGGVLEVLYVALGQALSNTGVPLTVPAEFASPVKWGVLASMLGKVGRAHDARRAEYCEMRFQEGVEAAKMILQGWS